MKVHVFLKKSRNHCRTLGIISSLPYTGKNTTAKDKSVSAGRLQLINVSEPHHIQKFPMFHSLFLLFPFHFRYSATPLSLSFMLDYSG